MPALDPSLADNWVTDAEQYTYEFGPDDTLYIGGKFRFVAKNCGNWAYTNPTTGEVDSSTPLIKSGEIQEIISDGAGGFYVAGSFTTIAGQTRNRITRILSDGTIDTTFQPPVINSVIYSLALYDGKLYIAGAFTTIGGTTRNRLAALNSTTGALESWNPNASSTVYHLRVYNGLIYAGGVFSSIGGATRPYLAALNTSGTAEALTISLSGGGAQIRCFEIVNDIIYFGGSFTLINGSARTRLAAIHIDGTLQSFAPTVAGSTSSAVVLGLTVSNEIIYFGGNHTTVNSVSRNLVAAVDTSGVLQSWNPSLSGNAVYDLTTYGGNIYFAGDFSTTAGGGRRMAAAYSTSGTIQNYNPNFLVGAQCIFAWGNTMIVGGYVGGHSTVTRNRAFAIMPNGELSNWNPNLGNGDCYAIKYDSATSTIYIGGSFTTVGGLTRNRLARVNSTTGAAESWNPNANNVVNHIDIYNNKLYVAGGFTTISGQTRGGLVAYDTATLTLQSFNPASSTVYDFVAKDGIIYAVGAFSSFGGGTRNRAGAVDEAGTLQSWNPDLNSTGYSLKIIGSKILIAGGFTTVGGVSRNRLALVDLSTGALDTGFNANVVATVYGIYNLAVNASGSSAYATHTYTTVGGTSGTPAKVNTTSGARETLTLSDTSVTSGLHIPAPIAYYKGALYYCAQNYFAYSLASVWQDTTAPTATLSTPTASQVISGPITLQATASDDDSGVASLKFQRQQLPSGSWVDTGTATLVSGTWQYEFDPTGLPDANYNFRAVATDYAGNSGNSFSVQAQIFLNQAPVNTSAPTITGTAKVGEVLTGNKGTWGGATPQTYAYQWQRSADGLTGWANISGATNITYTQTATDLGQYLRLSVTGTNASGNSTAYSLATTVVISEPINTVAPAISGITQVGEELSATDGTWTGEPNSYTYSYQWQKSATGSGSWAAISGATSSTFTPTSAERGLYLRVAVAATNSTGTTTAYSDATTAITMEPVNTTGPMLSYTGDLLVGNTITTSTGTWEAYPEPTYLIAWQVSDDGATGWTDISAETNTIYFITANVAGKYLRAKITADNNIGVEQVVYTDPTTVVEYTPTNTELPTISGITNLGEELTVSSGAWEGYPEPTIAYQWQISADGSTGWTDITGETTTAYTTSGTDGGKYLRVAVSGTNTVDTTTVYTSVAGPIAVAPSNDTAPELSGSAIVGLVISASSGDWTGIPEPTYSYQWQVSDDGEEGWTDIPGAEAYQYTIEAAYTAKYLRAAITATNTAGTDIAYTTASDLVVSAPSNTVRPLTNGPYYPGITIEGTAGEWDGYPTPTVNTQWQLSNDGGITWLDIDGETGLEYLITPPNFGQQVRILAVATNSVGTVSEPSDANQILVDTPLDNDRSLDRPFRVRALPPTDILRGGSN